MDLVHPMPDTSHPLVLPALRRLILGRCSNVNVDGDDEILNCLTCPNLWTLHLPMEYVGDVDLVGFLQQSSPALQDLKIGGCGHLRFSGLEECLLLVPALAQLELWGPTDQFAEEIFSAIADSSPTHILPNLCSLIIHLDGDVTISPYFWTTLLRALSGRCSQLTYFKMVRQRSWASDPEPDVYTAFPEPNVYTAFRQLAADGMEIHVGTEERSIISA
ncbi:hypothetical protein DFH07DRAFT_829658 [Mycena maculata]|uniref:Uncharacterized protein n=1 Tax=Mycena maculata TaxID=230809 RepID=A0AAD7ITG2_9AGAR|nr:hypothetical protein DFH07DRAFT_829658 [Mycena maculata]